MKDAKGHGSDSRGAAHQEGVEDAGRRAAFNAAKEKAAKLWAASEATGKAMDAFPRNAMGLTPDNVRATPEWRAAKAASDTAFQQLRNFNSVYTKTFAKELRKERATRRGS